MGETEVDRKQPLTFILSLYIPIFTILDLHTIACLTLFGDSSENTETGGLIVGLTNHMTTQFVKHTFPSVSYTLMNESNKDPTGH